MDCTRSCWNLSRSVLSSNRTELVVPATWSPSSSSVSTVETAVSTDEISWHCPAATEATSSAMEKKERRLGQLVSGKEEKKRRPPISESVSSVGQTVTLSNFCGTFPNLT